MSPPELQSIANEIKNRYRNFLEKDAAGEHVPDFLYAEEQVRDFVYGLGREMLQIFADVRTDQAGSDLKSCRCGEEPSVHRITKWSRTTLFGNLVIRDPYVYCRKCHAKGCRPLHALLGTDRETWSLVVQEAAVDLVSDESCGKAVAKLERHHPGVTMDRTSALRLLHHHGQQARAFVNAKLDEARKVIQLAPALRPKGVEELEVEFDGGMIPVATLEPIDVEDGQVPELTPVRRFPKRRKVCRWEEAKVGLVQKPGEASRLYSVQPTSGLEQSFDDLFALACLKGWDEQTKVRGIADGARHIRPRMEEAFAVGNSGNFKFILDRPHCKEHLSDAAEALEPFLGIPAAQWADQSLKKMEVGEAGKVVSELKQAWEKSGPDATSRNDTLRLEAGYFERNQDAVVYADYRAHGWSTASSEVESGHRHVVQSRVKISGAWWHPDHVDNILALRMIKANNWWDEYWDTCRQKWRKRAQGFAESRYAQAA